MSLRVQALALTLSVLVTGGAGCVNTQYVPSTVAPGELTLRSRYGGLEIWSGGPRKGQVIDRAWTFWLAGLVDHVRCVPKARDHATAAASFSIAGLAATAATIIAGSVAMDDYVRDGGVSARSFGAGVVAVVAALGVVAMRNYANGHAVDAMNYYNDAVGSLSVGRNCGEMKYLRPPKSHLLRAGNPDIAPEEADEDAGSEDGPAARKDRRGAKPRPVEAGRRR